MKKFFAIVAFVLLSATSLFAESPLRFVPVGYQQLTSISAATPLTIPTGATFAIITAEAQAARYRDDGSAPTSSVGQLLPVSVPFLYQGSLAQLQFIQTSSETIVNITYYK